MKKWLFFILSASTNYSLFAQNSLLQAKPSFQSSYLVPKQIIEKAKGHYLIDFGQDAFGTLSLFLKSTQTDPLVVQVGEKLNESGSIDSNPGGSIRYARLLLSNIAVKKVYQVPFLPDQRNTRPPAISLPDSFGVVMPFRYVEIENLQVPIKDIIIKQKVFNYRFNNNASTFSSSDTVLNRVWEMCKHTIKATSFAGLYIDGDRERTPYEADALINQLSHYCVDSEYSIARRTNEYLIVHPTWPTEWILHTVPLFYNDYLYTADTTDIAKYYEALKYKTLISLERKDGLISTQSPQLTDTLMKKLGFNDTRQRLSDIVDWPAAERDGYQMVAVNTVVNAFHYLDLKLMAEIAGVLHRRADSILFCRKSVQVKNVINQKLLDKTTGIYVDGEGSHHSSLHANMFALAFGIVPKQNIKRVVTFIKSRGMACSVYGAQYLLEALYQQGEGDYALHLMDTEEGDRNWWNMIKAGSTMAMEAWDIKYKPNLDWNHAWGTAPANIITRYMWGIQPVKPGFAQVVVKPELGTLTWSNIKVPTIKGAIHAQYKQINSKEKRYIIELPKGMKGQFVLTKSGNMKILVNGKKTDSLTKSLSSGWNQIKIISSPF